MMRSETKRRVSTGALALSALLLLAQPLTAQERVLTPDGKHLFILTGQSNMREPLPSYFRGVVEKVFGKDRVIVVHHNQNSQPIKSWYKEWTPPSDAPDPKAADPGSLGQVYDRLMKGVATAIKGQSLASVTLVWMQGEADAESGWGGVYEKSFLGLMEQFKRDLAVKDMNFVISRINDYWLPPGIKDGERVRDIQKKLGESHQHGAWVDTDDLNRGVNPWGGYSLNDGHFPNQGYRVLGQRLARRAIKLLDPARVLEESLFDQRFIGTSADIGGHVATGRAVTGTPAEGPAGSLAQLVDGKYGSADAKDAPWVAFAADLKTVELAVDLGESKEIARVGIDLLWDQGAGSQVPDKIRFLVSENGTDFVALGDRGVTFSVGRRGGLPAKVAPQSVLAIAEAPKVTPARFVRIVIDKGNAKLLVDEIVVNPTAR